MYTVCRNAYSEMKDHGIILRLFPYNNTSDGVSTKEQ